MLEVVEWGARVGHGGTRSSRRRARALQDAAPPLYIARAISEVATERARGVVGHDMSNSGVPPKRRSVGEDKGHTITTIVAEEDLRAVNDILVCLGVH